MSSRSREKQGCPGVWENHRSCLLGGSEERALRDTSGISRAREGRVGRDGGQRGAGDGPHQPSWPAELTIACCGSNPLPRVPHAQATGERCGTKGGKGREGGVLPVQLQGNTQGWAGGLAQTPTCPCGAALTLIVPRPRAATSHLPLPPEPHVLQPARVQTGSTA